MNIYVDKMPESCERCTCNDDYYRCGLSGEVFNHSIWKERMNDCQLKEITDVVEVVRCKDCKYDHKCSHNIIRPSKGGGVIYCPLEYCSEGERA